MNKTTISYITDFIISIFFPNTCSCCGKNLPINYKEHICSDCKNKLPLNNGLVCHKCSMPLLDGGATCNDCKTNKNIYFDWLLSPYIYKDNIRFLIHKFKYNKRTFLARDLSYEMIKLINEKNLTDNIDIVIPMPLHWFKKFKRGFNQAELIAKEVSNAINKPMNSKILVRKKYTTPQFNLNKEERLKNLEEVFCINQKFKDTIKGKNILLIDDIATTCTSANCCSKILKQAKAKKVFVVTVARD